MNLDSQKLQIPSTKLQRKSKPMTGSNQASSGQSHEQGPMIGSTRLPTASRRHSRQNCLRHDLASRAG